MTYLLPRVLGLACALFISVSMVARADSTVPPPVDLISESFIETVRNWATTPVVLLSIEARNAKQSDFDQTRIDALDTQWRAELKTEDQPLITAVLSNPLSTYLLRIQASSLGVYAEAFVMDAKGLNVGQSAVTSDYWQGDEAKFQKTFPVGPQAIFIDEPEYHEGTGTWRTQLNMAIADANGRAIGAVTVDVNLTELARRAEVGLGS